MNVTIEKYLIQARLPWKADVQEDGRKDDEQYLTFEIGQAVNPDTYAILPNDWPYNTPSDVEHVVVWSKVSA